MIQSLLKARAFVTSFSWLKNAYATNFTPNILLALSYFLSETAICLSSSLWEQKKKNVRTRKLFQVWSFEAEQ